MNLPDDLYREARMLALEEGRTVTSVLEQALRDFIEKHQDAAPRKPFKLSTLAPRPTPQPPIDVGNNAAIRDLLDDEDAAGFHANA